MDVIELIGRYVDGTLQDRSVHTEGAAFTRVPMTGRYVPDGWACDFDVRLEGQASRVTVTVSASLPQTEGE